MCGIIGFVGREQAAPVLLDGLARMEYRGYDSAGIAVRSTPIEIEPTYTVLKGTVGPAVLIEHGFHTNREDVALLKDSAYRQKLAEAEAKGILKYLGITYQEAAEPETPEPPAELSEADQAVAWITGAGIMLGDTSGDLMLDQPISRKQFAVMLWRFAKWLGKA